MEKFLSEFLNANPKFKIHLGLSENKKDLVIQLDDGKDAVVVENDLENLVLIREHTKVDPIIKSILSAKDHFDRTYKK